jgi:predicted MFS family arabinose efflux permease
MLEPALERLHGVEHARLAPLHYPKFRHAFFGRVVTSAGSWMQITAAGWLVYELTGNATAVGVLALLNRGPGLLSAYSGVLADRFEVRRLGMVLYGAQILPSAMLAVIAWDNLAAVGLIYVLVFISGVGTALNTATLPTLIPGTVPKEELPAANGLSGIGYSVAALVGPLIGGALVAAIGAGACFAANALSYAALVALMPTLPPVARRAADARHGLRPALAAAHRGTTLFVLLGATAVFALLVGPIQELASVIARRHSDGAHVLGLLLAALAAGGMIGNLLIGFDQAPRATRRRLLGVAGILVGVSMAALAVAGTLSLAMLAMLGVGVIWEGSFVQLMTWLQEDAPAGLSGREVGLFFTINLAGLALGALAVGFAFDEVGVTDGLLVCAGGMVAWGAVMLLTSPGDPSSETAVAGRART